MLDIKNIRPKVKQKAVYVTEDNIKEFLKYAFSNEFNLNTLIIDKDGSPYIRAVVKYKNDDFVYGNFPLNRWYVSDERNDKDWGWDECFEDNYEIEENEIMWDDKCKDCIYFHMYKKLRKGKWKYSSCCTYFAEHPEDGIHSYKDWVLEVDEDGLCEAFEKRKR